MQPLLIDLHREHHPMDECAFIPKIFIVADAEVTSVGIDPVVVDCRAPGIICQVGEVVTDFERDDRGPVPRRLDLHVRARRPLVEVLRAGERVGDGVDRGVELSPAVSTAGLVYCGPLSGSEDPSACFQASFPSKRGIFRQTLISSQAGCRMVP